MITEVTQGIKVSIQTKYLEDYSNPMNNNHVFGYTISIENNSDRIVQLLSRKWVIFDSCGEFKKVEGEGVVGQKPVLYPEDLHSYESAMAITTPIGRMEGVYTFCNRDTQKLFTVKIPSFDLIAPFKLN